MSTTLLLLPVVTKKAARLAREEGMLPFCGVCRHGHLDDEGQCWNCNSLPEVIIPMATDSEKLGYDAASLPHHYLKHAIEPILFIVENGLDFMEGNVVKYVARHKDKNGLEDLKKARRYLDMLIAREEGKPDWNK